MRDMEHEGTFIRLSVWTDSFNLIEGIARKLGGAPTNSPWECRNGLRSTSGYYFPNGVPGEFIELAHDFGAFEVFPPLGAL